MQYCTASMLSVSCTTLSSYWRFKSGQTDATWILSDSGGFSLLVVRPACVSRPADLWILHRGAR